MNMMKSYKFGLLLSLLIIIVNTSLSGYIAQFPPSLDKQIGKTLDKIKQSPPSDEQPTNKIQGLSQIKQYLDYFGYFQQSPLDFDDVLDNQTIYDFKTYQQFFNLEVIGYLNTETLQQISLPQCGVPDMNFEYGFTDAINISFPKGNKWFPKGKKYLNYGFHPERKISIYMTKVLRNVFTRWSQTTKVLNFKEMPSYDDADIKIGFYNINYNDEVVDDVVVGDTFISLKLDSNVKSGVIQLGASKC